MPYIRDLTVRYVNEARANDHVFVVILFVLESCYGFMHSAVCDPELCHVYVSHVHIIIGIDTNIEVMFFSLTTWGALGLWWASQVVKETTMTEIEVSISIISWWNYINDE